MRTVVIFQKYFMIYSVKSLWKINNNTAHISVRLQQTIHSVRQIRAEVVLPVILYANWSRRLDLIWLSALAMLLQRHATAAWLWIVSTPGVSVLGKMNRVVYSQAHVSTVAPDYIEPSFLWSPSSSLAVYIPFQCQLWIAILSHSAHVAKVYRSRRCWIRLWISWLSFSLSKISSFLMWSLLVTPSIFRRHDISNTLSRFCCVVFSVQVSELYNSVLSIIVS